MDPQVGAKTARDCGAHKKASDAGKGEKGGATTERRGKVKKTKIPLSFGRGGAINIV
jgi:hypothetical protein